MRSILDREAVSAELLELYEQDGELRASAVVARARRKSSAMHEWFEWDDRAAAAEHRLNQARKLIRTVRVVFDGKEQPFVHVPVAVREDEGAEGIYRPVSAIVKVEDEFHRAWREAVKGVESAQRVVSELIEASNGVDEKFAKMADMSMRDLRRAHRRLVNAKP